LWLYKYMSPATPYVNANGTYLVNGTHLMDTTPDLALITKDLPLFFPGIDAPGVFRRVDNIINEAVTMGTVARTNIVFPNYNLFENVQTASNDGNGTATMIRTPAQGAVPGPWMRPWYPSGWLAAILTLCGLYLLAPCATALCHRASGSSG
jgi:hypothetical protein